MPLLSLWKSNPDEVKRLNIEQVVTTAGDGRLKDASECQREFCEYLRHADVDKLAHYANHCLSSPFNKSGQVLQDVINELGRRLEYEVKNGRYQGTTNSIGYDGLWRDPVGYTLVVEVKTTDAYRLSLDTIAGYRDRLLANGELKGAHSILIVVGRTDTGELEAQVRGSRHAWDIRLISIDALLNLVRVKQTADSQLTIAKIRKLLTPIEYTRLDELVDVVFTAAQDVETATAAEGGDADSSLEQQGVESRGVWQFTPSEIVQAKRDSIVAAVGRKIGTHFVKKTRAMFWDPDHRARLVCTVSKRYINPNSVRYWYAYHPRWHEFLSEAETGLFVLGCVDLDVAFALPVTVMREHLKDFSTTEKKDGTGPYYHIKVVEAELGNYELLLRTGHNLQLAEYTIAVLGPA